MDTFYIYRSFRGIGTCRHRNSYMAILIINRKTDNNIIAIT